MSARRSFRTAVGWSFLMTGGQQVIALVVTFVLAGLLGPEAFGTVAMAAVYVAFVQLIVTQGMIPAIVQRSRLEPEHADTAFWITVAAATVMTATSVAVAPWWAAVNDLPDLRDVIWVLSLTIPLRALTVVPDALLRRDLDFRALAARTNAAALLGGLVGVIAAVAGAGVWALVAQQIVAAVVELVTLWAVSTWRPRRRFDPQAARDLWRFTSGASVAALGSFVHNRSDALFVGFFFGPVAVGLYRLAARLVNAVIDVAARALQQAALPELARLQDDHGRLRRRATFVLGTTAALSFPAFGLLAGLAPWIVDVLGDEWADAAVPLQLLCVVGAVTAFGMVVAAILQAIGRPHVFAVVTWIAAALSAATFVAVGIAVDDGDTAQQVVGLAGSRALLFAGPLLVLNLAVLRRTLGIGPGEVARAVWPSVLAGAVAVGIGVGLWALAPPLRDWFPGGLVAAALVVPATLEVLRRTDPEARRQLRSIRVAIGERNRPADVDHAE